MGGFRSRSCTEVEKKFIAFRVENKNGQHAGRFLAGNTPRIMQECKQFTSSVSWCLAASEWKLVSFVPYRPNQGSCTHCQELLACPIHIEVVHGKAQCFWKRCRRSRNPFASLDSKRFGKAGEGSNFGLSEEPILTASLAHDRP